MPPPRRSSATVNVIGQDKSGVVAKIASFLYRQGGNIEELDQHVTQGLFTMQMEISWSPRRLKEESVRRGLEQLAKKLDMTILFRSHAGGRQKPRLGLLVTTEDHTLDRVVRDCKAGRIKADIAVVIGNKPDLREHVEKDLGLEFLHVDDRDKAAHEAAMLAELNKREVDFVVLARYMRILSPNFVWRFPNRIVNIHPSLLPSFPGAFAYRQAHRHGVRIAGVTAHFVTMNLDEGPIITQRSFRIKPTQSVKDVQRNGRRLEGQTLSEAVQLLVDGRLDVHWGKVTIRPARGR